MEKKEIRAMQNLDQEIAELEKAILGTPEEPTEEAEQPTVPEMVAEPTEKVIAETTPLQKEYEQLQKRFNKYKGSSDQTIFSLRTEVKDLKKTIATLRTEIETLKAIPVPTEEKSITSYLSPEDQEVLGETAVNALDKSIKDMVNSQVNPLKDQLDTEAELRRKAEIQRQEQVAIQRQQQFVAQLSQVVPDFAKIVEIDDFRNRYLMEPDEYSGIIRKQLFEAAEEDGDVGRVASFFNEYKSFLKSKDDVLEQSVTPTGLQGNTSTVEVKPKWEITPAFIDNFYNDLARGDRKYKGKEGRALAEQIETAIDNFVMSGGLNKF